MWKQRLSAPVLLALFGFVCSCGGRALTNESNQTSATGGSTGNHMGDPPGDDPPGDDPPAPPAICDLGDDDGDGLSNVVESPDLAYSLDWDGDGKPNFRDTDSDNDGFSDSSEAGDHGCEFALDTDGDEVPDFIDADSDADGLADVQELAGGFDPRVSDSDEDGCSDFTEFFFGECNPENAMFAVQNCWSSGSGRMTLTAHKDIPDGLNDITLQVTSNEPALPLAEAWMESVTPSDAGVVKGGKLVSLDPGALLNIHVEGGTAHVAYTISFISESYGVVATAKMLWMAPQYCLPEDRDGPN